MRVALVQKGVHRVLERFDCLDDTTRVLGNRKTEVVHHTYDNLVLLPDAVDLFVVFAG